MTTPHDPATGEVGEYVVMDDDVTEEISARHAAQGIDQAGAQGPGQALMRIPAGTPIMLPDFRQAIDEFTAMREAVKQFIRDTFVESEYRDGKPVGGKLGDYYKVPGSNSFAPTQAGAEKIALLFQLYRGATEVTASTMTKDFCSARVRVTLVGRDGRPRGSGESGCNSAESGFTSWSAKKKYGAKFKKEGREEIMVQAPDYRAAENDLISRAGKRAFVQAVRLTAGLDEIFNEMQRAPVERQVAAPAVAIAKDAQGRRIAMLDGRHQGKLLKDLTTPYLVHVLDQYRQRGLHPDIVEVIEEILDARNDELRTGGKAAAGAA